jgi:uncharacterized protein (TIGR02996 family)
MTSHEAFLQAIMEDPDDDASRLVYADWLDEHGDADRAEFIRVQVELARPPEDGPRRDALRRRERRLLRDHRAAWEAARPAGTTKGAFVRGFLVPRLKEPADRFVRRRPEDFGPFPLWHITLTGLANAPDQARRVAELAACPHLLRAGGLSLTANAIGPEGAERFAACPHLAHVTALGLRRNWMRAAGVRALVGSASWPRLTHLDLGGNWIEDEGAAALAWPRSWRT